MDPIIDEIRSTFEQFKAQNDARLKEIEKTGSASAETSATVDRLDDALSGLSARLDATETRLNRPKQAPGQAGADDEAVRGFKGWMRNGIQNAAMQEATASEGGNVVPTPMADTVLQGLQDISIMRLAGCRIIPLTTWKMDFPTLTNSTAAVQTDEEAAVSEVEPTLGTIQAVAYKFTKLVKISKELVADSKFDVWGTILSPDYAQAFAKAENAAFTTGDGSGHPQGVVVGASAGATAASASAVKGDEVIDLYFSLDYRHRQNAKFMANDGAMKVIRKLKLASTTGGDDNAYLWSPGLQPGIPDTLLGRPLLTNNSMAAIAASAKAIVFGDFSYYWIFDRQEMSLQRLVELYAGTGQIGFLADKRFDGHVMLSTAFKVLAMASA